MLVGNGKIEIVREWLGKVITMARSIRKAEAGSGFGREWTPKLKCNLLGFSMKE